MSREITVDSNKAAPLGLVLNEILTNAIKHAYADGRSGKLQLRTRADGAKASITVTDDGPGMRGTTHRGLGRTLIDRLSRQLNAEVAWNDAHPGTSVMLSFPIENRS